MIVRLILAFALGAAPAAQEGAISGRLVPPGNLVISKPILVVALSSEYTEIWNGDVQLRLDTYWESYKPTFAKDKQLFVEVAQMAYRDALRNIIALMRRDGRLNAANFARESTPDGRFEFRNLPFGEYKIVAAGAVGDREFVWQEVVEVNSAAPRYVQLKKHIP